MHVGRCGARLWRPRGEAGPGCGARRGQRHHHQPNFARNLTRSVFETPQKRCNSNDANSMFELVEGELRAKLLRCRHDSVTFRDQARPRAPEGQAAVPAGGSGAWPRCPWAAGPDNEPKRRSKLAARTAEAGGTDTTASQISHVIYCGHFSRCPKNVAIPTMHIRCLNESSRNYVRNCWLVAIAGLQGDAPSRTSAAKTPLVWRAPEGPEGLAAVPVGGGGAWPDNEATRRAKLAARTARGRAAAHGHTKQPGPKRRTRRPQHPWGHKQTSNNQRHAATRSVL